MKKAFTLMEIIFVIVIIGILAGIAIPKLGGTVEQAGIVKIKSEIQAVRSGIHSKMSTSILADSASCPALEGSDNGKLFDNVTDGIPPSDTSGVVWVKNDDTNYTVSYNGKSTDFIYNNTISAKCSFKCDSSDDLCKEVQ
ncbi:MAG: prepilin-type N-terminal cleavage/methylation domain-containing protein [Chlorobi bacterium]|nr:prepilin-type N-terminal cleavage/methylation domain-containing protein [Chlorobiota bacterium]